MAARYRLEMLAIAAVLIFCGLFLYTSSTLKGAGFEGSDTAGSGLIEEISGKPAASFVPLIPQWQPPSAEIEACLFALQAAIGGIMVGGVFGYWLGQKSSHTKMKTDKENHV